MSAIPLPSRLGLNVPSEWWPSSQLLKSFEAAGFRWTQLPSPPADVLREPRACSAHARAAGRVLEGTALEAVVHGPTELLAGTPAADRALEGLLGYASDCGAQQVVYHASNLPDAPGSEDLLLAETRSLSRLALRAERLGVSIAMENLAPLFPGPETLSHTPKTLRTLARRISSPAVGLCLDLGHAHVVADLRHTDVGELIEPALDAVKIFHVHDNLGARRTGGSPPELDPLRLDLHLAPGRGSVPWGQVAPLLERQQCPLVLEVHPPHRPHPSVLFDRTRALLDPQPLAVSA